MNCKLIYTRKSFLMTGFLILLNFTSRANDSDVVNCNKNWKIVVLGSSTAFGSGATVYDSSWAGLFSAYVKRKNPLNTVVNLGIPGYTTYQNLRPTGYVPPSGRPSPSSGFNITAALAEHPDAIIINMPSNDAVNNYTLEEQQSNFEAAVRLADSANVPVWITTTQPRNLLSPAQMTNLTAMRDWITNRFIKKSVDFWTAVANPDGTIASAFMFDNVHVNNNGHRLFFTRMAAETILDSLCNRYTAACTVGSITGPANACAYTGNNGMIATYSVAAVGTSNIEWIVPEDADLISGQGTNTITLKYFSTFISGSITALVTTACGTTETRSIAVIKRSPVFTSNISGPVNVCQYTGINQIATYSVAPTAGAITYRWTLPPFVTLVSASADSTSINVLFGSAFTTSTNKKIRVQAISGCGNSLILSLSLNTTPPPAASSISGPTGVCANTGTTIPAVYKINKISGALSYNWQTPAGATVTHPAGIGINDTAINVIFINTFTSGNIAVAGVSSCGSGSLKTLAVAKSVPLIPDSIKTLVISSNCPSRKYSYFIPSMPAFASSVKWTVPSTATIDSGQSSTKINVTYNTSAVLNQVVRVIGINACGQGTKRELTVNLSSCTLLSGTGSANLKNMDIPTSSELSKFEISAFQESNKLILFPKGSDYQSPISIKIYSIDGRLVENISNRKANQIIHSSENLNKGIYLIVANQGVNTKTMKIFLR